jgi:hypothetical protein
MIRSAAALAAAALTLPAVAEDKKDDKDQPIKGAWVRETDGPKLTFDFQTKDKLVITAAAGDNKVTVTCKYTADKDGKVKATVTDVEEAGTFEGKPAKGYEFTCTFKVDGKTATLSDFKADNADQVKGVVEGEYKAKKDD